MKIEIRLYRGRCGFGGNRVTGVEGLRIADASIMPNTVRANTNVTTIMIGEMAADFIRKGL